MIILCTIVDFVFPIIIPIALAVFAALINYLARQKPRNELQRQIEPGYISSSPFLEFKSQFWYELSITIAFAYISYDIWALITVFDLTFKVIPMISRMTFQIVVIGTLVHFIYLAWRVSVDPDKILTLKWFNIVSLFLIALSRGFILWNTLSTN